MKHRGLEEQPHVEWIILVSSATVQGLMGWAQDAQLWLKLQSSLCALVNWCRAAQAGVDAPFPKAL